MGSFLSRLPGVKLHRQMRAASSSGTASRFAACKLLRSAGVPFCIWLEDALAHLGVPTLTFDLYLLVPDVGAAIKLLWAAGYRRCPPSLSHEGISQFSNVLSPPRSRPPRRVALGLSSADSDQPSVILLPVAEWFYELPSRASKDVASWFPTLPALYTSLVTKWLCLDEGEHDLRLHLAVFIAYIYAYLDGAVQLPTFEKQIPAGYRPFHRDQLRRQNTADLGTRRCQLYYLQTVARVQ